MTSKSSNNEEIELVFYGTNISKDSLWIENYDFLQFKMTDLFENWNDVLKKSHFVKRKLSDEELQDESGLEIIENDKYEYKGINHESLTSFLLSQDSKKFDVMFWIDCYNLVDIFVETKDIRTLFDSDFHFLVKKIKDLYKSLKPSAILVNLVYNENNDTTKFCGFEDFYDYPCIWCLDTYLFVLNVMNKLFDKLEPGVYQKNNVENIDEIIKQEYQNIFEQLFNIGIEHFEEKEKMLNEIDKTFFQEKLSKSGIQIERPIVNCIQTVLEEAMKTSNYDEK
jgi:hypothetical protein